MASITIRNLDEMVKQALRVQAARHGRSMEEEARDILRRGIGERPSGQNLAELIRSRLAPSGGVDLEFPPREPMRERAIFADEADE